MAISQTFNDVITEDSEMLFWKDWLENVHLFESRRIVKQQRKLALFVQNIGFDTATLGAVWEISIFQRKLCILVCSYHC